MDFLCFTEGAKHLLNGKELQRLEGCCVFFQDCGRAWAQRMACGDLLAFVRVEVVQVSLGQFGRAFFVHGALDHGNRVFGHDADGRVNRIHLAFAELLVDRQHFGLKGDQHVANIALQKHGSRIAPALAQHRHVFVQLADKLGSLHIAGALFLRITPGSQVGVAAVAAGFGVDQHDLYAGLDQVIPVLDVLGVSVAHQEQHGRGGGRCIAREFFRPVLGDDADTRQEINVGGGVHGHHIGVQPVGHRTRDGAGAAVRLVELDVLAGGFFVMGDEGGVVVFVKLARHVIGAIEQCLGRGHAARCEGQGNESDFEFGGHAVSRGTNEDEVDEKSRLLAESDTSPASDCSRATPSGHSPWPDSMLICPAFCMRTNSLPQARA